MDPGQYLMWTTKRKYSMSSNNIILASTNSTYFSNSYDESSWEEQAFAKDAAASAAGCIWPPRSYSCSFCRREFRSAQALGGHMNVHRRDRARLKQPSSPQNEIETHHHPHNNHVQGYPFSSLGNYLYSPSSVCGFSSNNTSPSYDHAHVLASPSKVLDASLDKNFREDTMIPLCNSPSVPFSSKSKPSLGEDSHELDPESDAEQKTSKGLDSSGCIRSERDSDEKTDVAVSLNLFMHRAYHPSVQFETDEEADLILKKRKTEYASSIIPLFPKSSSVDKHHHMQSAEVFEFSKSFIEELDLELRLG